jgi:hypothetical protein
MSSSHKLVGYDRKTDWVAEEYDIPPQQFDVVRRVAGVASSDPSAAGNYPLDAPAAQEVGKIIGVSVDTKSMDYFLEPDPAP